MRCVLVTGGAGFIGSNVARALSRAGKAVIVSDRMRSGPKWRNLIDSTLHDIILPEVLFDWLGANPGKVDAVVHLGAVSATTERDVDRITRENIRLSLDLWSWCSRQSVPFIYASSAATYGDGAHGFADDDSPEWLAQLRPLNAYGWSKNFVDKRFVADVANNDPAPPQWAGLKFFNVFGPGEDHKGDMRSVANKVFPIVSAGKPIQLFRSYRQDYVDGGQARDFVYVDDVVSAIMWLLDHPQVSGLFNVGSGEATTWNELAASVFAAFDREQRIDYIDMPPALRSQYQYYTRAPMTKLQSRGWRYQPTSIRDGVSRYAKWWLDQDRPLAQGA